MAKKKLEQNRGIINEELIQRLDNMELEHEYDPYQALKKTTVNNEDLFSEEDYSINTDDNFVSYHEEEKKSSVKGIVLGIIIAITFILIAVGIIYLFKACIS